MLGGETDADLDDEVVNARDFDDNIGDLSVLVTGRRERTSADDMVEALREIEEIVEELPADPGRNMSLARRLREALSSMTPKGGR